jgi:hypothetical protein
VPRELAVVAALFALNAVAVTATYWRFPPSELYHVHDRGAAGGFGRALVFLNYPTALVGIALAGLAWPRLRRRLRVLAALAIAMCAVLYWAVDQADLDAKALNAVPAIGVLLAAALVVVACVPPAPAHVHGDRLRIVLAVLLVFFAAPWIAAVLGFFLDGVPVLGWFFQTGRFAAQPGVSGLVHAVHHGEHHGWDGTQLALTALLLSRLPRPRWLDAYLALMLAYGVGNLVNDEWLEQVVKRGWTRHEVPPVQTPALNWGWLAVLVGAVVVWRFWFRQPPGDGGQPGWSHTTTGVPSEKGTVSVGRAPSRSATRAERVFTGSISEISLGAPNHSRTASAASVA